MCESFPLSSLVTGTAAVCLSISAPAPSAVTALLTGQWSRPRGLAAGVYKLERCCLISLRMQSERLVE